MSDNVTIPVLYSSKHKQHAPRVEFLHGKLFECFEKPNRVENIKQRLVETSIATLIEPDQVMPREAILAVHDADMVNFLEEFSTEVEQVIEADFGAYGLDNPFEKYYYPHTFPIRGMMSRFATNPKSRFGYYCYDLTAPFGKYTWEAALHSANLAYVGAELLLAGETQLAYTLCRPPGHHAGYDFFGGYCYINNAAIAAQSLLKMGKVAILDIDYHHGNGTQSIFWHEPNVLTSSIHIDATDYPFTGYTDEVGGEKARHTHINVPLSPGTKEAAYLIALDKVLAKIKEFGAQSLVLSAGFDTYKDEPMGAFGLEEGTYHKIGAAIAQLGLPTLIVQEGGYNAEALGTLVYNLIAGAMDYAPT